MMLGLEMDRERGTYWLRTLRRMTAGVELGAAYRIPKFLYKLLVRFT